MAADDFSNVNLPSVAWVSNSGARDSSEDSTSTKKEKNKRAATAPTKNGDQPSGSDLEFEPAKHELDDIA